jgi:outer membrane lipoprotein-sorting protein
MSFAPPFAAGAALVVLLVLLAGCATREARENLPTVSFHDDREALEILIRRADAVKTVSAQGMITLQRPNGESVRLDLAMVRAGADRLRLRAWKLGRAVFDLTMNRDGVWLLTPDDASLKNKARSAGLTAQKLAGNLTLLSGELFRRPDLAIRDEGKYLLVTSSQAEMTVRCQIERRTLTPRRYSMVDPHGVTRFTLELSRWQQLDDAVFPYQYVATSGEGTITVALREVELNGELAEGAFVPPKRAEKLQ